MTWIQTFSGVQFWPLEPRPEDVRMEDIAHALALKCRFGGHCCEPYSVAQHSLIVSDYALTRGVALGASCERRALILSMALLHDAGEAYLPDVCRPIKHALAGFDQLEKRIHAVVLEAFGLDRDAEIERTIKHCDDAVLATEARDLMGKRPAPWVPLPSPLPQQIVPMRWQIAKLSFISRLKAALRDCGRLKEAAAGG